METVYQILSNKKYQFILGLIFLVSVVFTFIFCAYIMICNADTVDSRYREERIRNEKLHENKAVNDRHEIVDLR